MVEVPVQEVLFDPAQLRLKTGAETVKLALLEEYRRQALLSGSIRDWWVRFIEGEIHQTPPYNLESDLDKKELRMAMQLSLNTANIGRMRLVQQIQNPAITDLPQVAETIDAAKKAAKKQDKSNQLRFDGA